MSSCVFKNFFVCLFSPQKAEGLFSTIQFQFFSFFRKACRGFEDDQTLVDSIV